LNGTNELECTLREGPDVTTIGMSDGRPKDPHRLRDIATWYQVFAERAANPAIWEARLRTAAELERDADRLEAITARETHAVAEHEH
jgi:hypothetical protein